MDWQPETLVAEPITAWRAWTVNLDTLHSTSHAHMWQPGEQRAVCSHEGPIKECGCGFYSLKTEEDILGQFSPAIHAWGEVEFWGKIVEGSRGYRSEYARIKNIKIATDNAHVGKIDHTAKLLKKRYQCPVYLVKSPLHEKYIQTKQRISKSSGFINAALAGVNVVFASITFNYFSLFNIAAAVAIGALSIKNFTDYFKTKRDNEKDIREV